MNEDAEIRVECPWCGSLVLPPGAVRCSPGRGGNLGLCEFTCPICFRLVLMPTAESGMEAVRRVGVSELAGTIPWELLEPHAGPPLSWDELLDLHLAVSRTCCPQEELLA